MDDWRQHAECLDKPELFFIERGQKGNEAKILCAECPVINECYEYAIREKPLYGIWAGKTAKTLRSIRNAPARKGPAPQHGYRGYLRGCRCGICVDAKNRQNRMAAERKKLRRTA